HRSSKELRYECLDAGFLGRLSHRKKITTSTAGTNGPHHTFSPNAPRVFVPPLTNAMMAAAQANALTRLSALNLIGFMPAYAHAMGIAVRRPGRNRLTRTRPVSFD